VPRATITSRCWRSVAARRRLSVAPTAIQLPQWQSDVFSIQSYAPRHCYKPPKWPFKVRQPNKLLYSVTKCRVREEAQNVKTEDVIMCCVATTIAHLM
jgi:hypothetical protein